MLYCFLFQFVSATFWGIYMIDRNLIFPVAMDAIIPPWLNHLLVSKKCFNSIAEIIMGCNLKVKYAYNRGFIKFLCRRSVGFYSRAFLVFLMKESKKRRRKQPGKLMAKSRSQPVNVSGAWPLMNPLIQA